MDPHRSSYPEEQEPRWYPPEHEWDSSFDGFRVPDPRAGGERYAPAEAPYAPAEAPYAPGEAPYAPAEAPYAPGEAPYAESGRMPAGGPVGRRSGEPLPPLPADVPPRGPMPPGPGPAGPPGEPPSGRFHTEAIDRGALRRGPAGAPAGAPAGSDGIYRARRPGTALVLGAVIAVAAVPLLWVLLDSLGSSVSPGGVVSSLLMLLGLPLAALGTYGLMTGAAKVPDPAPRQLWLRPPLVYLTVALVLFVAAGLAAA